MRWVQAVDAGSMIPKNSASRGLAASGLALSVLLSGASVEAQIVVPLGNQLQVNSYTTDVQSVGRVGSTGAGGFVVVWRSNGSSGTDTSNNSIQGQRYALTGSPLGAQFQVNSYTTSAQSQGATSSDGADGFVVVWSSDGSSGTDTSSYSIQGQRYSSTGVPLGTQFQVRIHAPIS
jgi:hypothetical protein